MRKFLKKGTAAVVRNPFPEPIDLEITDVLDLHGFDPRDAESVVRNYLSEARKSGFSVIRIVHGKGIGVQREMVRRVLTETEFVLSSRTGDQFSGGWGATIVELRSV